MIPSVNSITSSNAGFSSVISLSNLKLAVNLGVTKEERDVRQQVNISFKFYLKDAPEACTTDNIHDTVCYAEMAEIVRRHCNKKDFKLLEYLCYFLYREVRKNIPPDIKIWIGVEKCNPPIEGLVGSTAFEYTDI